MDVTRFRQRPVMGILRMAAAGRGEADVIEPLVETVVAAGLETLEIAMNTPGAAELIARARRAAGDRLMIGAGTVLNRARLAEGLDAGASFIVLPTLVPDVVGACRARDVAVFPGALTPQEIHAAWSAGATMVKVFPAKVFGPAYFREVKGPFQDVELLACGGVSPDNVASYFANGASAVAFGGSVFQQKWLAARDFPKIENAVRSLVAAYDGIRTSDTERTSNR